MAFIWNDSPTEKFKLPSGNEIELGEIDIPALIMSTDNAVIPNDLLLQISTSISGQKPDRVLTCQSATRLPSKGEPVTQDIVGNNIRGKVVDVQGDIEQFTVRVSMVTSGTFEAGKEIRFGGSSVATLVEEKEYRWSIGGGDPLKARDELPELGNFISMIARAAAKMPKLVTEVQDPETELDIKRVSFNDRLAIFYRVMPQEVRPAATFPEKPAPGVAAAPDVQGVSPQPGG